MNTRKQDQRWQSKVTDSIEIYTDRVRKSQHIKTRDSILAAMEKASGEAGFVAETFPNTSEFVMEVDDVMEVIKSVEMT